MASVVSRALARALTAMVGGLFAGQALAADMPFLSAPEPAPINQPVEFGSGWYLRADIGYENTQAPVVSADFPINVDRLSNATGGIGFGFQFNSWFRTDLSLDRSVLGQNGPLASIYCPYGNVVNVTPVSGNAFQGYLYNPNETCTPYIQSHVNRSSLIANAYFDIGNWYGITPYVGAGVGLSYLQSSYTQAYFENASGTLWAPNLAQTGTTPTWWQFCGFNNQVCQVFVNQQYPFAQINGNGSGSKKVVRFAWDATAGVSYDISQNLKLDLNYRFLGSGSLTSLPSFLTGAAPVSKELYSQEVRVGLRMLTD
ncbi:MAG TPA: hypothetical protein VK446_14480 [Methylocystis sp.]|nr:hypothetical protein [Methylocystis sp.]